VQSKKNLRMKNGGCEQRAKLMGKRKIINDAIGISLA
jgi:hypothetical protein